MGNVITTWIKGITAATALSAIPAGCCYFVARKLRSRMTVSLGAAGITGLVVGGTIVGITGVFAGKSAVAPGAELFFLLFFILVPTSSFLVAWAWGLKAFLWSPALAFSMLFLTERIHPDPVLGAGIILAFVALISGLTGFIFGLLIRRNANGA